MELEDLNVLAAVRVLRAVLNRGDESTHRPAVTTSPVDLCVYVAVVAVEQVLCVVPEAERCACADIEVSQVCIARFRANARVTDCASQPVLTICPDDKCGKQARQQETDAASKTGAEDY